MELLVLEIDVVIEHGLTVARIVLSPVGNQHTGLVHHLAVFEEIAHPIHPVVVQAVGIEGCLAVFEHHLPSGHGHLVVAVIIGILAKEREGIALIHLHISEGLKRVGHLIEMGTVAIKRSPLMPERD